MGVQKVNATETLSTADALFDAGRYEEAREACALVLAGPADASAQAEAAALMARTFVASGRLEDAVPWLVCAREKSSAAMPLGYSRYLSVRGRLEWKRGELAAAVGTFRELWEYCRSRGLAARSVDALRMLGIVSPPREQLEWTRQAILEAEGAGLTRSLASLWNNLGATHEELRELPAALEAYVKARDYHRAHSKALEQLIADWAVAHVQRLLGRLVEARELLTLLLPAFEELDNDEFFGWTCHELALIELVEGNQRKALDLFKRAKRHFKEAGVWEADRGTQERIERHIGALQATAIP